MIISITITLLAIPSAIKSDSNLICAVKILNHFVTKTDTIFINISNFIWTSKSNSLNTVPIVNVDFETLAPNKFVTPATMYLINITNNVSKTMEYYSDNLTWNAKAKFIFISSKLDPVDFNEFLKRSFIRNFVLITNATLHGWNFLDLAKAYILPPELLLESFGSCENFLTIFPHKFYSNYRFLQVRACHISRWPYTKIENLGLRNERHVGFEINSLNIMIEKLNLNLSYVHSPHPDIHHSATVGIPGTIDVLTKNQTDIFFGAIGLLSIKWLKYDYSISYFQGRVLWWTARSQPLPRWAQISYIFETPVWIALIFSIITINISWITLASFRNKNISKYDLMFSIYTIFIQTSSPKAIPISTLHVTWIWSTFVIAVAFNAIFFSFLSKQIYGHEIQSIQEAVDIPGTKFIFNDLQNLLQVGSYPVREREIFRAQRFNCTSMCLNVTAHNELHFMMGQESLIRPLLSNFKDLNGNQLLYSFEKPIKVFYIRIFLRKGYPLTEAFDTLILQITEMGLYQMWEKSFDTYHALRRKKLNDQSIAEALALQHLLVAFILLILGYILGFFVFVLEYFVMKEK